MNRQESVILSSGDRLPSDFEDGWPVLERALNAYPFQTCGKHHLWVQIRDGLLRLWRLRDSFMVTSAQQNPMGLWIVHMHLAGGDLDDVVEMEERLCEIAKANGMHGIQITGRRGWLKAFPGYSDAGTMMGKML